MLRTLISQAWGSVFEAVVRGLDPHLQGVNAHHAMLQDRLTRDQAFADSGFWDFALLSLYDYGVRRLVLGGVTALSEFGWTERALIGSSRALDFAPASSPLGILKNLSAVFSHLGMNLSLALAGAASLWMASAGSLAPARLADVPALLRLVRGSFGSLMYADYWFVTEASTGTPPFEAWAISDRVRVHRDPRSPEIYWPLRRALHFLWAAQPSTGPLPQTLLIEGYFAEAFGWRKDREYKPNFFLPWDRRPLIDLFTRRSWGGEEGLPKATSEIRSGPQPLWVDRGIFREQRPRPGKVQWAPASDKRRAMLEHLRPKRGLLWPSRP